MGSGLGKSGVLPVRVYISSFIHLDVLSACPIYLTWAAVAAWGNSLEMGKMFRSQKHSKSRTEQNRTDTTTFVGLG